MVGAQAVEGTKVQSKARSLSAEKIANGLFRIRLPLTDTTSLRGILTAATHENYPVLRLTNILLYTDRSTSERRIVRSVATNEQLADSFDDVKLQLLPPVIDFIVKNGLAFPDTDDDPDNHAKLNLEVMRCAVLDIGDDTTPFTKFVVSDEIARRLRRQYGNVSLTYILASMHYH